MKIKTVRPNKIAVWVKSKKFEAMYTKNELCINKWSGNPRKLWFYYSEPMVMTHFELPCVFISVDGSITFDNGRHRSRWLLNQNSDTIPVGLYNEHLARGYELGLIDRLATDDDLLGFDITFD
ncbi:hypothetical protein I6F48_00365 [Pseudoalteromonas sp. SWYJ118]|uniref:hypothetical protein n=1 Tax=Pseudoalteromonas sp. SWYJ118 TaxID=2792062 RepID=UPI0018CCB611|nr:hypothetical protein [Pseudoalteromonas sp. SWYJ118]MBH0074017.1 hypothetical protein [Pseudoalteromonas sp. SWYJ118]